MARKKTKPVMVPIRIPSHHREIQAFVQSNNLEIKSQRVENTLELDISGEIGWAVDDTQINTALREGDDYDNVLVRVNSPGGNAWTGVAIYNRLVELEQPVETRVMGEAASAASIIAMAGDTITMSESSNIRVHYPYVGIVGNADKLRVIAIALDEISDMMVEIYQARTGMKPPDIHALMKEDRPMYAAEAKRLGFTDQVTKNKKTKAQAPTVQMQSTTQRDRLAKWLKERT